MTTEPTPLTAFQQTYHWRNKNCGPWAKDWVKKTLPGLKVSDGALSAEITEVSSVEGDCDLGQRKGKLLTIYDIEIDAKWKGTSSAGDEVAGRLRIPEFTHEVMDGLEEYVFDITVTDSEGSAEVLAFARKTLPAALESTLNGFRNELLQAHGIFENGSGASTPAVLRNESYSPAPPGETREPRQPKPVSSSSLPEGVKVERKVAHTAVVEVSAQLQASAEDIWSLLTDAQRVPMWSRSAAKITPEVGTEYELFGGNVSGKITEVVRPTKLVQTWKTKSPGWPENHYGTMTISLKQGSDDTKVTFSLEGVPVGKESDIERAIDGFYIRGLKQMGLVLSSTSRTFLREAGSGAKTRRRRRRVASEPGLLARLASPPVLGTAAAIGLAAVFAGIVASSLRNASASP